MYEISINLDYFTARGVEQNLIEHCQVLKKGIKPYNQINGIRINTDEYNDYTIVAGFFFASDEIPIYGDKCYIDPLLYRRIS